MILTSTCFVLILEEDVGPAIEVINTQILRERMDGKIDGLAGGFWEVKV